VQTLPVGGAAAIVGRVLCSHFPLFNRGNPVSRVLSAIVQHFFYYVDKAWFRSRDPIGWLIVCRKESVHTPVRGEGLSHSHGA
jgi:hypothetical protein